MYVCTMYVCTVCTKQSAPVMDPPNVVEAFRFPRQWKTRTHLEFIIAPITTYI
jgi:hypothetical protein